ncbi:MAG: histidine kinase [Desulfobacteraceae bacterium]|nr:histidine kinase [Desulfobacteraceae bacterium]
MKRFFIIIISLSFFFVSVFIAAAQKHPSKKEVIKFVEEGLKYGKKHGKEAFFKELMNDKGIFKRGELYFYAYDFKGVVVAHGSKPHLTGKNLFAMSDKKGGKPIQKMIEICTPDGGHGWVELYWKNPVTKKVQKKMGYVVKLDDTCWFGSGTYVDE